MAKKYKLICKDNGKYKIENVPIFGLGKIRDFDYNKEWYERMLANMEKHAAKGYRAPIIIGHGGGWLHEKEAVGFLSNLKVSGNTVYADLDDINSYVAQYDIKEMRFPYRSVEVHNESAEISALALLGASEPYFKFPALEVYAVNGGGKGEGILYESDEPEEFSIGEEEAKPSWIGGLIAEISKIFTNGGKPPITKPEENEPEGGDMDREAYKTKYGCYPEEAADFKAKYEAQQRELEEMRRKDAETAKQSFAAKMQGLNVAPAATEMMQAFMNGEAGNDNAAELFGKLMDFAKEGKLFVPAGDESGHANKEHDVFDFSTQEGQKAIVEAIEKEMETSKCDYTEAKAKVYARIDAQAKEGK